MSAAGLQLAQGLEEVLQGVVGVGVVHDHREVLARLHPLEAAGHPGQGGDAAERVFRPHPEREGRAQGGQDVLHVEAADEEGLDREAARGGARDEARAPEVELDVLGPEVGVALEGIGEHPPPGHLPELVAPRVVEVEHRVAVLAQVGVEEQALGREVGVHVAVEIEVVAGEVGEDRDLEAAPEDALQAQGVRGHLEHAVGAARVDHLLEEMLEIRGFGSGADGFLHAVGDPVLHRAQEAHRARSRAQHGVYEVGRGGLSVRPRDSHELETIGGMAQERRGELREGHARVRDLEPRPARLGLGLGDDAERALLPSGLHVGVAVLRVAADGHEEGARRDPARVVGHVGDETVALAGEHRARQERGQGAEVHGRASPLGLGPGASFPRDRLSSQL